MSGSISSNDSPMSRKRKANGRGAGNGEEWEEAPAVGSKSTHDSKKGGELISEGRRAAAALRLAVQKRGEQIEREKLAAAVKAAAAKEIGGMNGANWGAQVDSASGNAQASLAPVLEFTIPRLNGRLVGTGEVVETVHFHLVGKSFAKRPRWFHYTRAGTRRNLATPSPAERTPRGKPMQPSQLVLLRINCTEQQLNDAENELTFINSFFERCWVPLHANVNDRVNFWSAFMRMELSRRDLIKRQLDMKGDPLSQIPNAENDVKLLSVLSVWLMAHRGYPLPGDHLQLGNKKVSVVPTRRKYGRVGNSSKGPSTSGEDSGSPPLFAIDCEMVKTTSGGLELARVTMINEVGEVLMDTPVLPEYRVTDYLTEFSGMTEESIRNCEVRLADVQQQISELLPPNAILVGHSLEFDLRALQMSHPYCIDIAMLFNFDHSMHRRVSLKELTRLLLDREIQADSVKGHCSLEDAKATMDLMQLKLKLGLAFGDVRRGWNLEEWCQQKGVTRYGKKSEEILEGLQRECQRGPYSQKRFFEEVASVVSSLDKNSVAQVAHVENGNPLDPAEHGPAAGSNSIDRQADDLYYDPAEDQEADFFDFESLVRVEATETKQWLIDHVEANPSKHSFFLAIHNPHEFSRSPTAQPPTGNKSPGSNKALKIKFLNTSGHSIDFIRTKVAGETPTYDVVVVEADCTHSASAEIDRLARTAVGATCQHGCIMLMLCSSAKSILYMRVKPELLVPPRERGREEEEDKGL